MTSGLVSASSSLPEWQAVKMIFFAPCLVLNLGVGGGVQILNVTAEPRHFQSISLGKTGSSYFVSKGLNIKVLITCVFWNF